MAKPILSMATEDVSQPIPSNETRNLVVDLYRNKYDANFVHFTELLRKHEDITSPFSGYVYSRRAEYILSLPKATKAKEKSKNN